MHLSDSIKGRINGLKFILSSFNKRREDIVRYQQSQMRRVLNHAYDHVPYYRRLFDSHGIRPGQIRNLDDLCQVPMTTKRDLKKLPARDVVSDGINESRLLKYTTSSTSGTPYTSRRTWMEQRINDYVRWRAKFHMGLKPGDRIAMVHFTGNFDPGVWSQRIWGLSDLFDFHEIDCLDPPEKILAYLQNLNPDVIISYPGVLSRVAELLHSHPEKDLSVRLVITGGEILTPHVRSIIENSFRTRVFNNYGCTEVNQIGWECGQTGLFHVCDDNVIVEIIRNGRSVETGETGDVVITALNAFAAPVIRYSLEDIAVRGPQTCSCGAKWSTLGEVEGRTMDYLILPDGRQLHSWVLFEPIFRHAYEWITQYQIIQEKTDLVVLRLVPTGDSRPEEIERISGLMNKILGPGVRFKAEILDEIPPLPNGKYANYVSLA